MFTKIAVFAACALALVSGQNATQASANTTIRASDVIALNHTLPDAAATAYGTEILGAILAELKIEHIDSKPLTDDEYNVAVDTVKDLLTGKFKIDDKKDFRAAVRDVLARLSPEDYEQLTDDVVTELTITFLKKAFGKDAVHGKDALDMNADEEIAVGDALDMDKEVQVNEVAASDATQENFMYMAGAFGGCVMAVVVALAVVGARANKAKATKAVDADIVVEDIEAAEKAAEDKLPANAVAV
ncbi:Aste57867_18355 [Aphanomyces stellatus]|uniref:Aste57867_18355 protein n=1 Tax=Aphanomyces stellatus TaxID=120398 RepID=A0A485LBH2_9STRA|nr:hypothetical protein As57867_018293 [Aphanomyces stellatus]VFT95091.1 Aste57867_18355 [Aphanomyces stellatus]